MHLNEGCRVRAILKCVDSLILETSCDLSLFKYDEICTKSQITYGLWWSLGIKQKCSKIITESFLGSYNLSLS